jgi:hypothetical protein
MGDWASCYHWIAAPDARAAARLASVVDAIDEGAFHDSERWAVRYGRIGRGTLFQIESVQKYGYQPLDDILRDALPDRPRVIIACPAYDAFHVIEGSGDFPAAVNYVFQRSGPWFDPARAADLLGGAVVQLGSRRALCLREPVLLVENALRWPALTATQAHEAPVARLLEALVLALPADGELTATFGLGLRTPAHGCVHTAHLGLDRRRSGDVTWPAGAATITVTGEDNSVRNVKAWGASYWALGALSRDPPLPDTAWPHDR